MMLSYVRCFMDCLVLLHYSELLLNVLGKSDYESNLHSKNNVLLSWSFVYYNEKKYINHSKYYSPSDAQDDRQRITWGKQS